jgi:hypothetical protein
MKRLLYILIPFIGILTLISCKKNEDRMNPVISIYSPGSGVIYHVKDTILVKAEITHDRNVGSVTISLVNRYNNPVLTPVTINTSGTSFTVEYELAITNESMETDDYSIAVRASDGELTGSKYQKIRIIGVERVFKKLIVVSQPNTLESQILAVDSNMSVSTLFSIGRNYVDSDISSKYQQFYFVSQEPSKLHTFDLVEKEPDWEFEAIFPYPTFHDVYNNDILIYLASGNGNLFGLNQSGLNQYVTPFINNRIPEKIYQHDIYMVSEQSKRNNLERMISLNYIETGLLAQETLSNLVVVEFGSLDDNEILVFANKSSSGAVYIYDIIANQVTDPMNSFDEEIDQVIPLPSPYSPYLVVTNSGIYQFNDYSFIYTLFLPVYGDKIVAADPVRDIMYIAIENSIRYHSLSTGGLIDIIDMDFPIRALHVQYNR